eukprot:9474018-Pyramimonas_sp.AAC.1
MTSAVFERPSPAPAVQRLVVPAVQGRAQDDGVVALVVPLQLPRVAVLHRAPLQRHGVRQHVPRGGSVQVRAGLLG